MKLSAQPHLVIPAGTKVLTRAGGRIGIVTFTPATAEHSYQVRFVDGAEEAYRRNELTIFKQTDSEVPGAIEPASLRRFVIFQCVVGSTAHGLDREGSDVDRRGFYLPPADLHWSLAGVPEQLETNQEECYWEIEKFIRFESASRNGRSPGVDSFAGAPRLRTSQRLPAQSAPPRHFPPIL